AGPAAKHSPFMAHSGPAGWHVTVLQRSPPYGLVQYVEPAVPGVPDDSRSMFVVGKAWMLMGKGAVAGLCEVQWKKESATARPPAGRVPLQASRGGGRYTGWEARRTLADGTAMRLRALCGASDAETAFVYLSAPDRSSLYEPVWDQLLLMNLGRPGGP
ncbi:MAG: hypothetical protein ACE5FC_07880, partial [Myxococcota bacterium]